MPTDNWTSQVPMAVTVTDANGIITEMNPVSIATFAADGGAGDRPLCSDWFNVVRLPTKVLPRPSDKSVLGV
jgi:hypothetical protein